MKTTRRTLLIGASAAPFLSADSAAKPAEAAWNPKISENVAEVEPATLRWLKQLGCRHVIFQGTGRVDASKKGYWTADDIRPHKKNCDDFGMILESMMIPIEFYWKARLGEPGRDQEIGNVIRTIQAAGKSRRAHDGVALLARFLLGRPGGVTTPSRGAAAPGSGRSTTAVPPTKAPSPRSVR